MKSKKIFIVIIPILVLVLAAVVLIQRFIVAPAYEEKTWRIGVVLPLTGAAASWGDSTLNGMRLALQEINREGKDKINLIVEDSSSDARKATTACQKLISIDKVQVIVGLVPSKESLACAPLADATKTIMMSTLASADKIKNAGDFFFRIRESGGLHSIALADYTIRELKPKKIAMLYSNNETGLSYSSAYKNELKKLNINIIGEETFLENLSDYRTTILKIKTLSPDVLFISGLPGEVGTILKQSKELDFQPIFLASPTAENAQLITIAGDAAEGLTVTSPAFDLNSSDPATINFISDYQKMYHNDPDFSSANGYDAIKLFYEIGQKQSSTDIKNALYNIKDYPGIGGRFSIDSFGEVQKQIIFKQVKDGHFVVFDN